MERAVALPFVANLVAALVFMPILAGWRSLALAADIVIISATVTWCAAAVWPHHRWVAAPQVPYLVWCRLARCCNCRSRRGTG
jgi:tryptophan-rich sensory protein